MAHIGAVQITGLGMSVLDLTQVVDAFPSEGGVTRVLASHLGGGGPVPTALCAAARFGASAAIIDRIGDDWRGEILHSDYLRHRVLTEALQQQSGKSSALATVLVRQSDGERHILYEESTATPLQPDDLPNTLLSRSKILHLNGRHRTACLPAAECVHQNGGFVSFDGGAHRYEGSLRELFPHVDLLVVAANFADEAVGKAEREQQLVRLGQWGARLVGITDGINGSWFRTSEDEIFHQPAFFAPNLVDTTGCGDVFHGVLLASIVRGSPWRECAQFASAAAALSATALGGRGYLPNRHEVEERIARSNEM